MKHLSFGSTGFLTIDVWSSYCKILSKFVLWALRHTNEKLLGTSQTYKQLFFNWIVLFLLEVFGLINALFCMLVSYVCKHFIFSFSGCHMALFESLRLCRCYFPCREAQGWRYCSIDSFFSLIQHLKFTVQWMMECEIGAKFNPIFSKKFCTEKLKKVASSKRLENPLINEE